MPLDFPHQVILRWRNPDPAHAPRLRAAGVDGVLLSAPDARFEAACRAAGIETGTEDQFHFFDLKTLEQPAGKPAIFTGTLAPGVQGHVRGDGATAAATSHPWVDANGYWPAYLRALFPARLPVLAYAEARDERALLEAWVSGAGAVLAPDPRLREAVLRGEAQRFARAAAWVREHVAIFRRPALPIVTVLVEPGEATAEIANLAFRHGVSPALAPAAEPPAPDPARILALVAVELQPAPAVRARILAHARAGSTVMINGTPWRDAGAKLTRKDVDRDWYALGRGRIVAYKEAVADPGELAFDMIDAITQERRPARIWNASAAIATAGPGVLKILNYGRPAENVLARIAGNYRRATLLRPESAPLELEVARRGSGSEVRLPELDRCALIVFG